MSDSQVEIGIVGGTGLYAMAGVEDAHEVEVDTPYGPPSGPIRVGTLDGRPVAFLARHGTGHRLLPTEVPYRANVWALRSLGVRKVVSSSAVGSLREEYPPRTLIVPDQFIDRTRHRPNTFFGEGLVAHVALGEPFSAVLRGVLVAAGKETGHHVTDGGTYLCMEGPQFSTRAESRFYRQAGCHIIGMTTLTEARLFREAEIAYAALCMVTDYDSWRDESDVVTTAEILAVLRENASDAADVIRAAVKAIPEEPLEENRSLATAFVTPMDKVPAEVRERLAPILEPYL